MIERVLMGTDLPKVGVIVTLSFLVRFKDTGALSDRFDRQKVLVSARNYKYQECSGRIQVLWFFVSFGSRWC